MITDEGQIHIKRGLAVGDLVARSIAVGVGDASETATDKRLQFEIARVNIALTTYDFVDDTLVFKARVPDQMAGEVTEVGLYSGRVDGTGWQTGSRLLSTFDSSTEEWISGGSVATFDVLGSRTGVDSLYLTANANGSQSATLDGIFFDLSGGSLMDTFSFAFYSQDANTSSISVRFKNDAQNYFQFSLTPSGSGYQIANKSRSEATVVGTPRWEDILLIETVLNAGAGGTAIATLDAIRTDSKADLSGDNVLIARDVLTTPFTKQNNRSQEIEFRLGVSIV